MSIQSACAAFHFSFLIIFIYLHYTYSTHWITNRSHVWTHGSISHCSIVCSRSVDGKREAAEPNECTGSRANASHTRIHSMCAKQEWRDIVVGSLFGQPIFLSEWKIHFAGAWALSRIHHSPAQSGISCEVLVADATSIVPKRMQSFGKQKKKKIKIVCSGQSNGVI